jgi:dUTPase
MANVKFDDGELVLVKEDPTAELPIRATPESAGYDVTSVETVTIAAGKREKVNTGLRLRPPNNTFAFFVGRSGMMFEHDLHTTGIVVCIQPIAYMNTADTPLASNKI